MNGDGSKDKPGGRSSRAGGEGQGLGGTEAGVAPVNANVDERRLILRFVFALP